MAAEPAGGGTQSLSRYADMLQMPHPEPRHHPRMQRLRRAAQFAPFAALTGYEEIVNGVMGKGEKRCPGG